MKKCIHEAKKEGKLGHYKYCKDKSLVCHCLCPKKKKVTGYKSSKESPIIYVRGSTGYIGTKEYKKQTKFCWYCGSKKEETEFVGFNTATGKKNTTMVCPNKKCYQRCILLGHNYIKKHWYSISKCSCCNKYCI
ncbi:MAG: hypothetical protein NTW30_06085 [Candidatus Aenigmarchaeota archaeon]|nr:hypothetical protein [Candidatus Aenigmarchaeota archaeon]